MPSNESQTISTRLLNNSPKSIISEQNDFIKNDQINGKQKFRKFNKNTSNEKTMKKWKLVPPDGGWGWLVLFGSTLVNILVPGTVKSFGVLFVEFLEVFEASPAAAAWIPAFCYFLYSSLGPVSSILSVKWSYRTVTFIGGTFAAAGMIISFYAYSVTHLCISYGLLVGIGAGLSFPPTVYIVTSYFVRFRGLANGLCISGSAIGSIVLPPVLRVLLELYGYRGAVLLMGGVTLNVWVAALFYDPVDKHMKKVPIDVENVKEESEEQDQLMQPKFLIYAEENSASLHQIPNNETLLENNEFSSNNFNRSVSSAAMQNYMKTHTGRERKISVPAGRSDKMSPRSYISGSGSNMNSSSALHVVPESNNAAMDIFSQRGLPNSKRRSAVTPKRSPSTSSFQYVSTPYHGSTLTLQPETFASSFSLKTSTCVSKNQEHNDDKETKKNNFFDISLLKDPLYLIILISNSTNAISYTNFIILLPSYAQSLGFDKNKGALLLSIVSALDLVGRIGGSALSDLPICPKHWYFIGGVLVSGISLALLPFAQSYIIISVYCALFGLASGVYVGVTAVIMADMLGTERLQSTYGISLFVNGLLQLIGPPLCGIWFERQKNYFSLFCTLGVVLIVGAAIWGLVPCIKKKKVEGDDDDIDKS